MSDTVNRSIKALVGRKVIKNVPFCDGEVVIEKLSVAQVKKIQDAASANENQEDGGLQVLREIIGLAVEGGSELTLEDFESFPMEELSKLSDEIMVFSGIANKGETEGKSD